ncbi:YybH family protein [Paludisphaera soli]|uniref:YybH family protein n=1 Tax=Paludisphaera soli TaxID=2712865 RepID=UPI0013EAC985|nr:SgcJ/EcaC family oxidoreductase [Paludisphaera soli]
MFLPPPSRITCFLTPLAIAGVLSCLQVEVGPGAAALAQAPSPSQATDRPEDREAIRSTMESFVKAFKSRDAKALAAHWTTDGEYEGEAIETVRGRDALEKGFEAFFARTPEVKADSRVGTLRFLGSGAAIAEGSAVVRRGSAAPASQSRFKVLFVREDGRWLIAQMGESSEERVSVADLSWLVGEWKSVVGQGTEIRTTYAWSPGKKFLHSQFSIREKEIALTGSQVTGVDPETGALHTWTFEADGGVSEADWTADGDHWVLQSSGSLADGRTLIETNILRRVNDDLFTWQSIDRQLDDVALPDLAPVKVARVKTVE